MTTELARMPARSLEHRISHAETTRCLTDIRRQARHVHLAVVADRPDIALHAAGQIVSLAERRLRQLSDDAA